MWRGGRFKRDICICIADPHCCTAETNTTLERNYTPIKKKKKICWVCFMCVLSVCWNLRGQNLTGVFLAWRELMFFRNE